MPFGGVTQTAPSVSQENLDLEGERIYILREIDENNKILSAIRDERKTEELFVSQKDQLEKDCNDLSEKKQKLSAEIADLDIEKKEAAAFVVSAKKTAEDIKKEQDDASKKASNDLALIKKETAEETQRLADVSREILKAKEVFEQNKNNFNTEIATLKKDKELEEQLITQLKNGKEVVKQDREREEALLISNRKENATLLVDIRNEKTTIDNLCLEKKAQEGEILKAKAVFEEEKKKQEEELLTKEKALATREAEASIKDARLSSKEETLKNLVKDLELHYNRSFKHIII